MLYYQNVVLLNAFYRHQIVLFFKGSAICFFTSYLMFNRACSEPVGSTFRHRALSRQVLKTRQGKRNCLKLREKKNIVVLLKLGRYGYRNYSVLARVLQILCPFIHEANNNTKHTNQYITIQKIMIANQIGAICNGISLTVQQFLCLFILIKPLIYFLPFLLVNIHRQLAVCHRFFSAL